jgi:hypothetical protein
VGRFLFVSAVVYGSLALGAENYLNPGLMGPNALPPMANEAPWVGTDFTVSLALAGQRSDDPSGASDFSYTIPFRVEIPFKQRATFFVTGTPFEGWLTTARTRVAWRTDKWREVTRGDLRFGAKFLLWDGAWPIPSVSLRVSTKTTTGKGATEHRFLNAPGYQFDLLVSERFRPGGGPWQLEVWASLGFLAWQQAGFGQNDAPAWAVTLAGRRDPMFLSVELRGYKGWQQYDNPLVLATAWHLQLWPCVWLQLEASRSFRDPPGWDLRAGFRFDGPMPEVLR